jgi:hypothetical protein
MQISKIGNRFRNRAVLTAAILALMGEAQSAMAQQQAAPDAAAP